MENSISSFQFIMIKTKAVKLGLTEHFFNEFKKAGLSPIWQKQLQLSKEQVEYLYRHHNNEDWFNDYVEGMINGNVIISLWKGKNNITETTINIRNRLREEYKDLTEYYDVHTSDSQEDAINELRFLIGREIDEFYYNKNKERL